MVRLNYERASLANLFSSFKNPKVMFAFGYDLLVAAITFWLALVLRFDTFELPHFENILFNRFYFVSLFIFAFSFILNGLYQGVWRFSSMYDLVRVVKASAIGIVLSLAACFFMIRLENVPRSMFLIQFLLLVVGLGGGRFIYRFFKDQLSLKALSSNIDGAVKNVLIVGAGRAGEKLARDILSTSALKLKVVGFVDDDKFKRNALIHNIKVFGSTSLIPVLVNKHSVHKIFIALPSADGSDIKRIVGYCKETDAEIKILPKIDHLLSSQVELSLLRNLNIEDLLGRQPVVLDTDGITAMFENKTVFVTGAGGSIGSELCFQIAKFSPKHIVMIDSCELFMYELELKFKEVFPNIRYTPKILDIRNRIKMEEVFIEHSPHLIFHAAAYKHVPMMEMNPLEAIETNVGGTKIITDLSLKYGAEKFVMISTDKAVNPTNIMGATKRIAEMVVTRASIKSEEIDSGTQFISVRFGNVLGSNGSVVPLFMKQIEERKDITVTHPDIIRYFMSISEACQLVIQAGVLGKGGEIFVLDMGEPVKIVDLAREMIKLAGLIEGKDINIVFTGLRPGEKLYEELFSDGESCEATSFGKIRKAKFRSLESSFESLLDEVLSLNSAHKDFIPRLIKRIVPEFDHFSNPSLEESKKVSQPEEMQIMH